MAVEFVQPGKIMNVTLAAAAEYHALIAVGDKLIGVTRAAGAENDVVGVDVEGVFTVAKDSGSALAIGKPVTVDVSTGKAAATSSGNVSNAVVAKAAASADTKVDVKINVFIPVGTINSADLSSYETSAHAAETYSTIANTVTAVEAGTSAGKIKVTKNSVATEFSVPVE